MPLYKLPVVTEQAKKLPLSIDPKSGNFIFYDNVENGLQKIVPIERLNEELLEKLVIERQLCDEHSMLMSINGETYSNERRAHEIRSRTKVGEQIMKADINYLRYFLSEFPRETFED